MDDIGRPFPPEVNRSTTGRPAPTRSVRVSRPTDRTPEPPLCRGLSFGSLRASSTRPFGLTSISACSSGEDRRPVHARRGHPFLALSKRTVNPNGFRTRYDTRAHDDTTTTPGPGFSGLLPLTPRPDRDPGVSRSFRVERPATHPHRRRMTARPSGCVADHHAGRLHAGRGSEGPLQSQLPAMHPDDESGLGLFGASQGVVYRVVGSGGGFGPLDKA